jgi:hypothetical protein
MDSDSLKYINDRYGHAIGDMHLIHLAETMKAISRKSDILARYAGDEFMIILPNTKKEDASVMAERLRTRIENSPLSVDGSPVVATVSVGGRFLPGGGIHCGRACQRCGCRHVHGETAGEEQGSLCLTLRLSMWLKAKSALMLSACQGCGRDMKAYRAFTAPMPNINFHFNVATMLLRSCALPLQPAR